MYKNSWIGLYYNVVPKLNNGVISFWDPEQNVNVYSYRWRVLLKIPEKSRHYFLSTEEWNEKFGYDSENSKLYLYPAFFTNIPNGFPAYNTLGTRSKLYVEPYFLFIDGLGNVENNYLPFENIYKANSEKHCLAMLTFNDENNHFITHFSPVINLPDTPCHTIINSLECLLCDSKGRQVEMIDNCRLFMLLKK
jgi:hypothetical protein